MRKLLISAALLSSVALAAPAAAQYRGYGHGPTRSAQIERQMDHLADRIRRAEDRDIISKREEDRLLDRLRDISRRYDSYRRDGLSQREHHDLQMRLNDLRQRLRDERREHRWDDRRDRDRDRDRDRWDDRGRRW